MTSKITTAAHLAITGAIMALITVVFTLIPGTLGALDASKQVQIEWLNSLLKAVG
jgi:hypothetical protein